MKKLLALLALVALTLGIAGQVMGAEGDLSTTGRVVFVTGGDVEIAADEQADAVIVISGDVEIAGTVNGLVLIDGTVSTRTGATLDTIVVVNGTVDLSAGTTVQGDVLQLNSTVNRAEGVAIGGSVKNIAGDVAGFAVFMGFAALAVWIGVGIATILGGLLVAGLAGRQARSAAALIRERPGRTFLVGLLAIVVTPVVAGLVRPAARPLAGCRLHRLHRRCHLAGRVAPGPSGGRRTCRPPARGRNGRPAGGIRARIDPHHDRGPVRVRPGRGGHGRLGDVARDARRAAHGPHPARTRVMAEGSSPGRGRGRGHRNGGLA
jgi:hypothetical protein